MTTTPTPATTPDYIVIGAGSAGSVLARRLTDSRASTVLLIEAGADERPDKIRDPASWASLIGSEYDWGFHTEAQHGLDDRVLVYPRGRVVGGSSSVNGVVHIRGRRSDFDDWAEHGARNWSYDDIEPFMDRSEHLDEDALDTGGVHVSRPFPLSPIAGAVLDAMSEDDRVEEVGMHTMSVLGMERSSAADGYLTPAVRERPALTLLPDATVTRLVIEDGTCVGVEVTVDSERRVLRAGREVLLAAGAIGSPHLLMVSGIGPAAQLESFGIPVLVDAPDVGENLQDHPRGGVTVAVETPTDYVGEGVSGLLSVGATDVQLLFTGVPQYPDTMAGPERGFTLTVSPMHPTSRGTVRLTGPEIADEPAIDPALLATPEDLAVMVEGIRIARQLIAKADLDEWEIRESLPGPSVVDDADLATYARQVTQSYYHAVGTCRLGSDERSVVDEDLRVRGVDGLRVVDASVMPSLVSANPNPTVYTIAERAASMILAAAHDSALRA
ncbi:GMC family oxidoreductase [Curtobacterium sp. MCBD17_030]|uniref:GMC family oxidoreductase n=1 Tax=Curtobacterium sp. MCBD17_030 TaxID=2175649 RepID=UPI0015E89DB2|nr:GMC family oxidoreductase N-terminal domain-containing protein [Curtobacterium sp. MCBD17_030]